MRMPQVIGSTPEEFAAQTGLDPLTAAACITEVAAFWETSQRALSRVLRFRTAAGLKIDARLAALRAERPALARRARSFMRSFYRRRRRLPVGPVAATASEVVRAWIVVWGDIEHRLRACRPDPPPARPRAPACRPPARRLRRAEQLPAAAAPCPT